MSEKIQIGYIAKAHGIKGEVLLKLLEPDEGWFNDVSHLFLSDEHFKILKKRPHKEGYILILEEIEDRNTAELLKGKKAYLEKGFFSETKKADEYFLNEIDGFKVFVNKIEKGKVSGFASTAAHEIVLVKNEKGLFEIPWVKDFIVDIDFEKSEVQLDCPEELFMKNFGESKN